MGVGVGGVLISSFMGVPVRAGLHFPDYTKKTRSNIKINTKFLLNSLTTNKSNDYTEKEDRRTLIGHTLSPTIRLFLITKT